MLLAEEVLKRRGYQDLKRQCPMGTGSHAAQTLGSILLAFSIQTCLQEILTTWLRGFPSSSFWLGQPQNGIILWYTCLLTLAFSCCCLPPSAAVPYFTEHLGCPVLILCYTSNGKCGLRAYSREPSTWIWSPGLRSWFCHSLVRYFSMLFSFLGLYFLVPQQR